MSDPITFEELVQIAARTGRAFTIVLADKDWRIECAADPNARVQSTPVPGGAVAAEVPAPPAATAPERLPARLNKIRECLICGLPFRPKQPKSLCCSTDCTDKHRKQVKRVWAKQSYQNKKAAKGGKASDC